MSYVYPDSECRLLTPVAASKWHQRRLHGEPGIQRISIVNHMGTAPYVQCWCGKTLPLDYSNDNGGDEAMTARLTTFLNDHETCSPPPSQGDPS